MVAVGVQQSWEYQSDVRAYDTMLVSQCIVSVWERGEAGSRLAHTEIHHHYLSHFYNR